MNVFATGFPILTLLTVLPLVGATIALFSGRHARYVAVFTTLACLVVSLFIWMHLPGDGSIGLVERAAWAPSLGIEYHLGVDGLGALMLVLTAIVTLMSVDAAHRVHHMPGLFYGLALTLEAGLFGSFTALNFFHWFLFWELSLIPAFFLIKLWGGPKRGPAATQFFIYTMAGSVALLLCFLAIFLSTGTMDFGQLTAMAQSGALERAVTAHLGPVTLWLAIGVLAGFAVKVPLMPFHTWLPAAYAEAPSPVTMLLTGRHVEDGRLRPAPYRAADLWAPDRADPHAATGSRCRHRRHGRMGRGLAERFEARPRVLLSQPPRLLPARHLRDRNPCIRRSSASQSGCRAQWRHPADVQPRHYRSHAFLVHVHDPDALWRRARHRRLRRVAQARACSRRPHGHRALFLARPARPQWFCRRVPHLPRRFFLVLD